MDKKDTLTYYGRCRNCNGIFANEACVSIEEIPEDCPECGGKLDYRFSAHQHPMGQKGAGRRLLLVITVLAAMVAGSVLLIHARLSRSCSSEEVAAAQKAVSQMTASEILLAFGDGGIRESSLASILHSSRFTLGRIRSGDSFPTPSMDAAIKGLYTDYLLLSESKLLFLCRYGIHGVDQFYAFPNPLQETEGKAVQPSLP